MAATGLAIIWHSRTGAARTLALAARDGAAVAGAVQILSADEATPGDLLMAQGYLFCCPENLATMTGAMKEFFDRCYYPLLGRIEGRPYATMIAAGSDGTGAQAQVDQIATGWRLRRVADPFITILDAQTPERILAPKIVDDGTLAEATRLGRAMGEGLALGVF